MTAGWDMAVGGWIWMLFWIGAFLGVVWLLMRHPGDRPPLEDAMGSLRTRFARGEIDQAEFERALDALRQAR